MKKLAIFVEGQTEQVFIQRLIEEIAGRKNLTVRLDKFSGGAKTARTVINEMIIKSQEETKYYVLIRDSANDSRVVSDIRDTIDNLMREGYQRVLGLRDLYPENIQNLTAVQNATNRVLPRKNIPTNVVIAVREIETWFLAELKHYEKIHPDLNLKLIEDQLNINLSTIGIESIENPSETLHQIYKLVQCSYRKTKNQVQRTVNALDIESVYLELTQKLNSLNQLIADIDEFLVNA